MKVEHYMFDCLQDKNLVEGVIEMIDEDLERYKDYKIVCENNLTDARCIGILLDNGFTVKHTTIDGTPLGTKYLVFSREGKKK